MAHYLVRFLYNFEFLHKSKSNSAHGQKSNIICLSSRDERWWTCEWETERKKCNEPIFGMECEMFLSSIVFSAWFFNSFSSFYIFWIEIHNREKKVEKLENAFFTTNSFHSFHRELDELKRISLLWTWKNLIESRMLKPSLKQLKYRSNE